MHEQTDAHDWPEPNIKFFTSSSIFIYAFYSSWLILKAPTTLSTFSHFFTTYRASDKAFIGLRITVLLSLLLTSS